MGGSRVPVRGSSVVMLTLFCCASKIKPLILPEKHLLGRNKNLAYLDPSLKVDPIVLTLITHVLCALKVLFPTML